MRHGTFEYEGGDMEYLVEWEHEGDDMSCQVFIVIDGKKVSVDDNLYDAITERIAVMAWDHYFELLDGGLAVWITN